MYKLHPATFYKKTNDNTLCYQTKEHKVYVFNAIVGDILDAIKPCADMQQIIDTITKLYIFGENRDENIKAIENFVSQLISLNLVVDNRMRDYFGSLENRIITAQAVGKLDSVMFELTYRCSEKCRHCYVVQEDKYELTTDEIKSILDDLAKMEVTYLTFTGGEPFLRKDFIDILKYAYNLGFITSIFTNGISITDEQFFDVAECYPRNINFSIYSSKAEVHDSITQVKGSFKRTLKAIKRFLTLGISVNIKTLIMSENFDDIDNLIKLSEDLGATIQVGASISPKNDRDTSPLNMRVSEMDKLEFALRKSRDRIEEIEGVSNGHRDIDSTICGAGLNNLSINPQGIVYPCNALLLPVGTVREESIVEIWNNSYALKEWRNNRFSQIAGCEKCDLKDYCGFCPGTALTETGSAFKKYEEACRIAYLRRKIAKNL